MEFWNDLVTDKSWRVLLKLNKEFDFIIIGGWATYLHTKTLKSKDIDIVVGFETLEKMGMKYRLKKNMNLKKYEIKVEQISVDIYVPYFSDLVVPVQDLSDHCTKIEGMKVLAPEILLILKQGAEIDRKDSIKGQKDRADILNLIINSSFNFEKYFILIKKYKLQNYISRLKNIIKTAKKEFDYLGIKNPRKIKIIKKELNQKLKFH